VTSFAPTVLCQGPTPAGETAPEAAEAAMWQLSGPAPLVTLRDLGE
jgi:hypothetical protein